MGDNPAMDFRPLLSMTAWIDYIHPTKHETLDLISGTEQSLRRRELMREPPENLTSP
jgi:hypothetical protein